MKTYKQPLTETLELTVSTMIAESLTAANAIGDGWHSKSRDDEDEEAYIATEGEGEAQYGDLW